MSRWIAALVLAVLPAAPALANAPPRRFDISLGAFSPRLSTLVRLDGAGGLIGAELDFEENFNLDDRQTVPLVSADFNFSKRHGINLTYFDLARTSSGESTISFRFGDQVFPASVPLAVKFNTEVLALTYSYKFFNDERRSFGINAGFNVNKVEAGIATTEGPSIGEEGDATAPLPVFGVNGHKSLGKKWRFYGTVGIFALSFNEYDGRLYSISGGFFHQTWKNVGFGVGVYAFQVRLDSEAEDFSGKFDYSYTGPAAYLNLRFR
jgi:hypothetical protein